MSVGRTAVKADVDYFIMATRYDVSNSENSRSRRRTIVLCSRIVMFLTSKITYKVLKISQIVMSSEFKLFLIQ